MKRDTIGKLSLDLAQKTPDTRDPVELEREMHKDYEYNVLLCVERGKKDLFGDFYVVVETKKERLMDNVLRNFFFYRKTCPTPTYDQTVYRYDRKKDEVDFLWVLPSKDTCQLLTENALQVVPEERDLLMHVLSFSDGSLLKLSKKLNGENEDSPLLAN